MQDICIALASKPFVNRAVEQNLAVMLASMEEAAQAGADLICFGEAFLQGFDCLDWDYRRDRDMALEQHSSVISRIREASREKGIDVLFGYIEREAETIYSSCMLVEEGRIACNYRRISRGWKEYSRTDEHYREGDAPRLFTYRGWRCAIALCGDLWDMPGRFVLGEQILFWPLYCSYTREEWLGGTLEEYAQQCRERAPLALMINSICPGDSVGGCAAYRKGRVEKVLEPGMEGLLYIHPHT